MNRETHIKKDKQTHKKKINAIREEKHLFKNRMTFVLIVQNVGSSAFSGTKKIETCHDDGNSIKFNISTHFFFVIINFSRVFFSNLKHGVSTLTTAIINKLCFVAHTFDKAIAV